MTAKPSVTVVIPTRNSATTLGACLGSVVRQSSPGIEIVVVDRDSTDGTPELAEAMGARVLSAGPERSAQRNAGARAARGRWVLFIDSDMVLTPEVVASCLRRAEDGVALVIPEEGFSGGLLTRARALEKRCYEGNESVEAARFFLRRAFLRLGGYDEKLTAGEDWDLTDRWRESGGTVGRVEERILHDDRQLTFRALLAKRFRYGRLFVAYVRKDPSGAVRHLGAGRFLPRARVLLREPGTALTLISLRCLEALFFVAGMLVGWARRARRLAA